MQIRRQFSGNVRCAQTSSACSETASDLSSPSMIFGYRRRKSPHRHNWREESYQPHNIPLQVAAGLTWSGLIGGSTTTGAPATARTTTDVNYHRESFAANPLGTMRRYYYRAAWTNGLDRRFAPLLIPALFLMHTIHKDAS